MHISAVIYKPKAKISKNRPIVLSSCFLETCYAIVKSVKIRGEGMLMMPQNLIFLPYIGTNREISKVRHIIAS